MKFYRNLKEKVSQSITIFYKVSQSYQDRKFVLSKVQLIIKIAKARPVMNNEHF